MSEKTIQTNGSTEVVVGEVEAGMRLDSFLASRFSEFSRAKVQRAITLGNASIDGVQSKSSVKLTPGQKVQFRLPRIESDAPVAEDIDLDIVFEDEHLIGINKPPGMVVHPAKGHWSGTLTSALAFHFEQLSSCGGESRPGIVHRLDRDTSGIIVIAKTDDAHARLAQQFESRTVEKTYWAIVTPAPDRDRDEIKLPIGSHPYQREKMAIRSGHKSSRNAQTFYEVQERQGRYALLAIAPKTGRTHQIRVHLAHIGSPVLCDRLYGGRSQITELEIVGQSGSDRVVLNRQALHAKSIQIRHPVTNETLFLEAPPADDLKDTWTLIQDSMTRDFRRTD